VGGFEMTEKISLLGEKASYVKCRKTCKANLSAQRCWQFRRYLKDVPTEEYLAPGHRGCAGCGNTIAARLALKASGKDTIVVSSTGCLEVTTTPYPETAWKVPWIHANFENAAAVASGIEAALKVLIKKGKRKTKEKVFAIAGDGGTVDIGLQALSGAMERGHNMVYICIDNEAYMNTGVQRSSSTPYGASTTTSPAGKFSIGEDRQKKDVPRIIADHDVPYVATASIAFPLDYMEKVKKAVSIDGPSYIHVLTPCPTGWGFPTEKTIELGRLAVDSGMWVLYEIINGKERVTYKPTVKAPVGDYLKQQKRFRHLDGKTIEQIQENIDERWKSLFGG
jgi:pyruvate ferredoxin oxidoreductase beta subunit